MKNTMIEVQTQTLTLDGSVLADQIALLIEKTEKDPLTFNQNLRDFYFHGVCEGAAMAGHRVKSITARDKTPANT